MMRTFLAQPEATFYHVTTEESWQQIQQNGIRPRKGRLFVSRVGELPVLISIALQQLPEHKDASVLVFLKLPQAKNGFSPNEVIPDYQASEWSKPLQNIILRNHIPVENIELMMTLRLDYSGYRDVLLTELSRISQEGEKAYPDHFIMTRAAEYTAE